MTPRPHTVRTPSALPAERLYSTLRDLPTARCVSRVCAFHPPPDTPPSAPHVARAACGTHMRRRTRRPHLLHPRRSHSARLPPHATRRTPAPPRASHRAPHATRTPYAHAASRRSRDTPHATRMPVPPARHAPRALPTPPARATRARTRKPPAPSRSAQWTPRRRQG